MLQTKLIAELLLSEEIVFADHKNACATLGYKEYNDAVTFIDSATVITEKDNLVAIEYVTNARSDSQHLRTIRLELFSKNQDGSLAPIKSTTQSVASPKELPPFENYFTEAVKSNKIKLPFCFGFGG